MQTIRKCIKTSYKEGKFEEFRKELLSDKNKVYVGRRMVYQNLEASKWMNPYSVKKYGRDVALQMYRKYIINKISNKELDIEELRGKSIYCWCKEDEPCHVDILIELLEE